MTDAVMVTKFKCGNCGSLKETKEEADKHCICKCGRPVKPRDRTMGTFSECNLCDIRGAVIRSKARVRKMEDELVASKEHLAKLEELFEAAKTAAKNESRPARKLRLVSK